MTNEAGSRLRLAYLAGLVFLTGCTSISEYVHNGFKVGPNFVRPEAPVAADWIDASDKRVRKDSDDLAGWWKVFGDPAIDSLVCDAYRQNLTLKQAGFQIMQARAQWGFSIGALFPQTQTANGSYQRIAITATTANRSFVARRFFEQSDYSLNLAWELDFWGRYRRAIESAQANLDASVDNYDDVLVTMLSDVVTNYVILRTLEQRIQIARENVELQRKTLQIAQARFNGGTGTELDVDQAQSTLSQTQALIPLLESQLRQANNALCVLLGIAPENLVARLGAGGIPTAPLEVAVGIPADLLRRRPDIRRAERLAAAQSAQIGIAEADFYPRISLSGNMGYSAEHFVQLFRPESFVGTFAPNFEWNILNYGRILNNVRAQDAQFQNLAAGYQQSVLTGAQEVENGLIIFLKSQERVKYLAESVDAAQKAVNVAVAQYQGGKVDFNRVALLQQNLVLQQDVLTQARGDVANGLILIYRALGGGWQIRETGCEPSILPAPHLVGPQPNLAGDARVVPAGEAKAETIRPSAFGPVWQAPTTASVLQSLPEKR